MLQLARSGTCGAPPTTRRTRRLKASPGALALTYCRYPPIPSLATDATNRRHLDYCTPLLSAYALLQVHPSSCLALPGSLGIGQLPQPIAVNSPRLRANALLLLCLLSPMLCRHTMALTACLALAYACVDGFAAVKGSVTFKLRVLDLCFPRGASIDLGRAVSTTCLVCASCYLYHAAAHSYRRRREVEVERGTHNAVPYVRYSSRYASDTAAACLPGPAHYPMPNAQLPCLICPMPF